jgi:predicted Na+-dependent transporter
MLFSGSFIWRTMCWTLASMRMLRADVRLLIDKSIRLGVVFWRSLPAGHTSNMLTSLR